MPELHSLPHACEIWLLAYKVFVGSARALYFSVDRSDLERRPCGLAISGRTDGMSTHVALITGALTGIGRAAALAFAREGHRIVVAGRHEQAGQDLATELRALALKSNSSAQTSATRTACGTWSIGPSRTSAAWTQRSNLRTSETRRWWTSFSRPASRGHLTTFASIPVAHGEQRRLRFPSSP